MKYHGQPLNTMLVHGFWLCFVKWHHVFTMVIHSRPLKFMGTSWSTMVTFVWALGWLRTYWHYRNGMWLLWWQIMIEYNGVSFVEISKYCKCNVHFSWEQTHLLQYRFGRSYHIVPYRSPCPIRSAPFFSVVKNKNDFIIIWLDKFGQTLLCPYKSYSTTVSNNIWNNERFLLWSWQRLSWGSSHMANTMLIRDVKPYPINHFLKPVLLYHD